MLNDEQIAAYREMAKNAGENGMEAQIRANLESTCAKFSGNEDKFERCMAFLNKVCMEMLGGADAAEDVQDENYKKLSGDIPDEVCFRILNLQRRRSSRNITRSTRKRSRFASQWRPPKSSRTERWVSFMQTRMQTILNPRQRRKRPLMRGWRNLNLIGKR